MSANAGGPAPGQIDALNKPSSYYARGPAAVRCSFGTTGPNIRASETSCLSGLLIIEIGAGSHRKDVSDMGPQI